MPCRSSVSRCIDLLLALFLIISAVCAGSFIVTADGQRSPQNVPEVIESSTTTTYRPRQDLGISADYRKILAPPERLTTVSPIGANPRLIVTAVFNFTLFPPKTSRSSAASKSTSSLSTNSTRLSTHLPDATTALSVIEILKAPLTTASHVFHFEITTVKSDPVSMEPETTTTTSSTFQSMLTRPPASTTTFHGVDSSLVYEISASYPQSLSTLVPLEFPGNFSTITVEAINDIADIFENSAVSCATLLPNTFQRMLAVLQDVTDASLDILAATELANGTSNRFIKSTEALAQKVTIMDHRNSEAYFSTQDYSLLSFILPKYTSNMTFVGVSSRLLKKEVSKIPRGSEDAIKLIDDLAISIILPQSLIDYLHNVSELSQNIMQGQFAVIRSSKLYQASLQNAPANLSTDTSDHVLYRGLASWIIGASLGVQVVDWPDSKSTRNYICAFWNVTAADGKGKWENSGCKTVGIISTYLTCRCNHLTSFGVLVDFYDEFSSATEGDIYDISTKVAISISLVGFSATIAMILCLRKWAHTKKHLTNSELVMLNLSATMVMFYVSFLGGIDQMENPELCVTSGAIIQYFFLVSFAWEAMEGYLLYKTFASGKGFPKVPALGYKAFLICWGIPLLFVCLSLGIDYEGYLGTKSCWLDPSNGIQWYGTLIAPVCAVLLGNMVIFVLVFKAFIAVKLQIRSTARKPGHTEMPVQLRRFVTLIILLGLPWILIISLNGVGKYGLGVQKALHIFVIIFCGLQGFGIFYIQFHGMKKEIRHQIKERALTTHVCFNKCPKHY